MRRDQIGPCTELTKGGATIQVTTMRVEVSEGQQTDKRRIIDVLRVGYTYENISIIKMEKCIQKTP